jgi:hypothetical protein
MMQWTNEFENEIEREIESSKVHWRELGDPSNAIFTSIKTMKSNKYMMPKFNANIKYFKLNLRWFKHVDI